MNTRFDISHILKAPNELGFIIIVTIKLGDFLVHSFLLGYFEISECKRGGKRYIENSIFAP